MILAFWLGCSTATTAPAPVNIAPEAIGLAECAVCGMVVGEQPSPRGQVVYRDGTHAHVCSVEELRAISTQPSSKGKPVGVYVETFPSADIGVMDTAPLPWSAVEDVWFVFGAKRPLVMGEPVLTFSDLNVANAAASKVGTVPLQWPVLTKTPFHLVPTEARSPRGKE